ncbi:NAD(P)/FAD-dependent oxidoreductase [Streptomyces canus]|uniref:flavin-containing monooxygenase n=1 Tax=Streptomyces canus TaxID=58343 RepID=UPI00037955D5|nr:NAD(P)/FAD-dependent oxidoreductase [Streptomyces canus]
MDFSASYSDSPLRADLIERAVDEAELPALLACLAVATGDESLIPDRLRPDPRPLGIVPARQGGLDQSCQQEARRLAVAALQRLTQHGATPEPGLVDRAIAFISGPTDASQRDFLREELGLDGDLRRPGWSQEQVAPGRRLRVAVIGAGLSGLLAMYRLAQVGVDFVGFERRSDVGGVWFDNDYPGARLDANNFLYSYSFAQKAGWKHYYSSRDEVQDYLRSMADAFGVRQKIRFGTAVTGIVFDDDQRVWRISSDGPDGPTETLTDVVISAVGQLSEPKLPDIPGLKSFAGESWHTARWNHRYPLTDKRVAVIGTGASAYQVVPSIADAVGHLDVFQRSAPWMVPTPTYHDEMPPGLRWLFTWVPNYHSWYRFYQFWHNVEGRRRFAIVDPSWDVPGSVSPASAELRSYLTDYIRGQYEDRPDLAQNVVPAYPPYGKRMLRDNGVWASTLHRDNVALVTQSISEIVPSGVRTCDGRVHECDAIVYATGFVATDMLNTLGVRGRGGRRLSEVWGSDPAAYLGITVPGFPNFFCLYGPNTNLVVNGSIVTFSESSVNYVMSALHLLLESQARTMEVRQAVLDDFVAMVDEANRHMAWGVEGVDNWYKAASGRVSQVWPLEVAEYWRLTRRADADHFDLT